jgi:hypothetical protein
MTEKSFLVKRFYNRLVEQARNAFSVARTETDRWLTAVPLPLETQIRDHKNHLQQRLDSLTKINDRNATVGEEVAMLSAARQELMNQFTMINGLMKKVKEIGPSPP